MRTIVAAMTMIVSVIAIASTQAGCSSDDSAPLIDRQVDGGAESSDANATSADGSADAGSDVGDGGGGDALAPRPTPGTYMGVCTGDGGFFCDPGLTCKQYVETSGGKGCGQRICTRACDGGCGAPAVGCDSNNQCQPRSCL